MYLKLDLRLVVCIVGVVREDLIHKGSEFESFFFWIFLSGLGEPGDLV